MRNLLTLLLAVLLVCLTTLYPTKASACSATTMTLIQQTYGTSNIVEDAFGNVTVLDAGGNPIAVVQEVNGFAFTRHLNGFYASPGAAFIPGGPLNPVGLEINAGFLGRSRFGFRGVGLNGFNGLGFNGLGLNGFNGLGFNGVGFNTGFIGRGGFRFHERGLR